MHFDWGSGDGTSYLSNNPHKIITMYQDFLLSSSDSRIYNIPYSGKVWRGKNLANWLVSSIWRKKIWRINRSTNRLFIVSTNLHSFSLANRGRFAKFAKLSRYTVIYIIWSYYLPFVAKTLHNSLYKKDTINSALATSYVRLPWAPVIHDVIFEVAMV